MRQIEFKYLGANSFEKQLDELKKQNIPQDRMLFCIYTEILEEQIVERVYKSIEKIFPDAEYFGCSTAGNITNCGLATEISVVCMLFEKESTKFLVKSYEITPETDTVVAKKIVEEVKANPWTKAVELYLTIPVGSPAKFCQVLDELNPDIKLFGGVACSNDITSDESFVFSKNGGYLGHAIIVVMYGGDELYVDDVKITGWKQLKRKFRVTSSEGNVLKELDGVPAYNVYSRYLGIENSENFFYNTLEFPLFYEHNGTTILRVPLASNPDGSIIMSSDIDENSIVRLSYGDPQTIVESMEDESQNVRDFAPEVLHIFSCAARRTFWDKNEPTYELEPFKEISSSAGFFSHGEYIREKGYLNPHNVTLVIAFMREGEHQVIEHEKKERELTLSKIPLVSRLARFIAESTRELEEAVIMDGLTGLYNRKEIQSRIEGQLMNVDRTDFSLIMLDIDNFKRVNDTYGHQVGDMVIKSLSGILKEDKDKQGSSGGRWGGEEFMLLLPDADISVARTVAESIRKKFEDTKYADIPSQTVSIGITQAKRDDTIDKLCTRVDTALYEAKKSGKNKVVEI